jgi:hypothetical protein
MTTPKYIFQGNIDLYRHFYYLSLPGPKSWSINKYRDQIQIGDRAYVWLTSHKGGMVALIRVISEPMLGSEIPNEIDRPDLAIGNGPPEFKNPDNRKVLIEVVELGFVHKSVFCQHEILKDSLIVQSPRGTVFKFNNLEASAAYQLWQERKGNL